MFTTFDRERLARLEAMVAKLLGRQEGEGLMATLAEIKAKLDAAAAQVAQNTSVIDSAVTVLATLKQQVADLTAALANAGVPQELVDQAQAIVDGLTASDTKLAESIAQSTPAQP